MTSASSPWDVPDVDEAGLSAQERPSAAAAVAAVRTLSRRDDLRAKIARASVRIDRKDALVAAGIGLLGAVPATQADEVIGEWLARIPGVDTIQWTNGAPSAREAYARLSEAMAGGYGLPSLQSIAAGPEAAAGLPLYADLVQRLPVDPVVAGQFANRAQSAWQAQDVDVVEAFLIPDGEDIFGSALTRLLTDRWVKRRGWAKGDQAFHEFKALAYGTTSVLSVALNPNPVAMGLAAWHLVRAMLATRSLTEMIVSLKDVAIAESRQVISEWDRELAASGDGNRWTALVLSQPLAEDPAASRASSKRLRDAFGGGN
jgi:hypothetical protein